MKHPWLTKDSSRSEYLCKCLTCNSTFSCAFEGLGAVKRHETSQMHLRKASEIPGTSVEKMIRANQQKDSIEPHVILAGSEQIDA